MRDLANYPVTAEEAISALQIAFEQYASGVKEHGIGNVDGIAILMTEKFLNDNKDKFNAFSQAAIDAITEKKE